MGRLTDRKTATELKENAEKLRAVGIEPTISDLRYIKLAEYENRDERRMSERLLSYQLPGYALDEDPQEEIKWTKENPALTPFINDDKQLQEKKYCKDCIYHRFIGKWLFCDKYDVPVVFPNSCDNFIPDETYTAQKESD